MKQAIKVLEKRIGAIKEEIVKVQKVIDEPEMLADYEFAMTDLGNMEGEIMELEGAIEVLNECVVTKHNI